MPVGARVVSRLYDAASIGTDQTRIHVEARRADIERVRTLPVRAAAELEHAQDALVTGTQDVPRQLDDPVDDRELGKGRDVLVAVLADEKHGRVVRGQQTAELVHHQSHLVGRGREVVDGLERVDHDDLG